MGMEKKLWFRAKRYGWGWFPVAWQGWAVIFMYVFSMIASTTYINNHEASVSDFLGQFLPQVFVLTAFLIIICYKTGEEPKWRWGKNKDKENNNGTDKNEN